MQLQETYYTSALFPLSVEQNFKGTKQEIIKKSKMAMFACTDLSNLLSGVRVTHIGRDRDVQAGYGRTVAALAALWFPETRILSRLEAGSEYLLGLSIDYQDYRLCWRT